MLNYVIKHDRGECSVAARVPNADVRWQQVAGFRVKKYPVPSGQRTEWCPELFMTLINKENKISLVSSRNRTRQSSSPLRCYLMSHSPFVT
jgi:hypothetical protein